MPWPTPVAESEPNSSTVRRWTAASPTVACSWQANCRAAIMGPTVCELEGPMPILNRSKTLTDMESFSLVGQGKGAGKSSRWSVHSGLAT
ncbi:hypothetical protein D3C71_1568350 [compost metagenome]